jgi:hypothetical protein
MISADLISAMMNAKRYCYEFKPGDFDSDIQRIIKATSNSTYCLDLYKPLNDLRWWSHYVLTDEVIDYIVTRMKELKKNTKQDYTKFIANNNNVLLSRRGVNLFIQLVQIMFDVIITDVEIDVCTKLYKSHC